MNSTSIRVFIGSGEASRLERQTLIYSIRKHTNRPVEIYVFNGTHDALQLPDGSMKALGLPLNIKTRFSATEFSHYRYLIPELCNNQGRAIWLDSDMICLRDIGGLFDAPMGDSSFLALADGYSGSYNGRDGDSRWGTSVLLLDCQRCRFNLPEIFSEIDNGEFDYYDFSRFSRKFLAVHPFSIGSIDPNWNSFDYYDELTNLIHYTKLDTQPWKFAGHPYGDLWFQYFNEARAAGVVTDEDIALSKLRGYVRQDLHMGNSSIRSLLWNLKKALRDKLTPDSKRFDGAFGKSTSRK